MTKSGTALDGLRRGLGVWPLLLAAVACAAVITGCGVEPHDPEDFVGTWSSTDSDAVIVIHEDLTFEATGYPMSIKPGGTCDDDDLVRQDWSGEVDPSTIDTGFVYVNEGQAQWWTDISWKGKPALVIVPADCTDELRETFEKE